MLLFPFFLQSFVPIPFDDISIRFQDTFLISPVLAVKSRDKSFHNADSFFFFGMLVSYI